MLFRSVAVINTDNDTAGPAVPVGLGISPDTGISSSDGITSTGQVIFFLLLDQPGLVVRLLDVTLGIDLGSASVNDKSFSRALNLGSGVHTIRARATDQVGKSSESLFGVIVDQTMPNSRVDALPTRTTTLSFAVSVTGSDPAPGRLGYFEIFVAINGGAWELWRAVPADGTPVTYSAQSNQTLAFRSVAYDAAGNAESKAIAIEASTYVPDLTAPITQVSAVGNTTTPNFIVNWQGSDAGGSGLRFVDLYVKVDNQSPRIFGRDAAGMANAQGAYYGTVGYAAVIDGVSHSYRFYSVGIDGATNPGPNVEEHPTAPQDVVVNALFVPPLQLRVESLDVEKGRNQRSIVRNVDVVLNSSAGLNGIIDSVKDSNTTNDRVRLTRYDLNGNGGAPIPLGAYIQAIDRVMALDFGSAGLDDGYYRLELDLDGDGAMDSDLDGTGPLGSSLRFYRLLADVDGNRKVDGVDVNQVKDANKFDWEDLNRDLKVDIRDVAIAQQSANASKKLADGLNLDD